MSTLIAYASKRGFTKECVEMLAEKLDEKADICDLGNCSPDPAQYDKVIVGGSVYMGKIRKRAARFCSENLSVLKDKKLGLFMCGMAGGDDIQKQLESVFPEELRSAAVAVESFGGEFNFDKMNPIERFMIKKFFGLTENQTSLIKENITRFAELMKNA